jgi:hypothetical protein
MKRLFSFSLFLALLGIFLAGCKNSGDITSPAVTNLEKPAQPYTYSCNPTTISENSTATVDLVAGQHNPVGTATFHLTADGNLEISYNVGAGNLINEVHIDFATTLNNDASNGGFHANKAGNPQPGHFDINVTLPGNGAGSWTATVSKADLLSYLNLSPGSNVPEHFYIAAHGVVSGNGSSDATCPTLPDGKYRYVEKVPGSYYYLENAGLYETEDNSALLYTLNGWCIDRDNGAKPGEYVKVDFLCSQGNDISCFVDLPQNIGAVNWLLNNKNYNGNTEGRSVQVAIWKLIDTSSAAFKKYDTTMVNALYNEALNHKDFVAGCGQLVGLVMYQDGINYCSGKSGMQVFLVERTIECGISGSETMWGFDWDFENGIPLDNYSCRFVDQGNWARYFQF